MLYCSWLIVDSGCIEEEVLVWVCAEIDDTFSWTLNDLNFTSVFDTTV